MARPARRPAIEPALALPAQPPRPSSSIDRAGIEAGDAMAKRAPIDVIRAGTVHPGKYLVLVGGAVADVEEALEAGREVGASSVLDVVLLPERPPGASWPASAASAATAAGEALGIIETATVAATIEAADAGLKGARVRLLELRLADDLGGKGYLLFDGAGGRGRGGRGDRRGADRRVARPRPAGHRPAPRRDGREPGRRRALRGPGPGVGADAARARHRHRRRHRQDARPRGREAPRRPAARPPPAAGRRARSSPPTPSTWPGPGELVYFVAAREAAQAMPDPFVPVDHAIVGIVDAVTPLPGDAAATRADAAAPSRRKAPRP